MIKRIGNRTLEFTNQPTVRAYASVAGKKESEGPLGGLFDKIITDSYDGLDTYEDAESQLQTEAMALALKKGKLKKSDIDFVFAGDLLNQCVGSSFGLKDYNIPYLGQYGACSTMAQNIIAASVFVESGAAENAGCSTSSHFCSAERQYRYPAVDGHGRRLLYHRQRRRQGQNQPRDGRKNHRPRNYRRQQYGRRHGTCRGGDHSRVF